MFDRDLFGNDATQKHKSILAQSFDYPPFSVMNARDGWWQDRKRQWLALGIQSELGRGGQTLAPADAQWSLPGDSVPNMALGGGASE